MRTIKQGGFTLIELMITVAIVGLLAAIAYPSYISHLRKGSRASAKAQMLDLANREQQYLLANRGYGAYDKLVTAGYSLPTELNSKYTPSIACAPISTATGCAVAGTVPAYTITFTATGTQVTDGDLTLNSDGAKSPTDKW